MEPGYTASTPDGSTDADPDGSRTRIVGGESSETHAQPSLEPARTICATSGPRWLSDQHARLPPRRTGLNAWPGNRIFASGNRAGRCRWSAGLFGAEAGRQVYEYLCCVAAALVVLETGSVCGRQLQSCDAKVPMRVIEVSMEQRRNEMAGETSDPRENPPNNGIVRHDSHMRRSGVTQPGIEPGSPWWEASRPTAQPPWPPRYQCPMPLWQIRFVEFPTEMTSQARVTCGIPLTHLRLVTYSPPGRPSNREDFAARSSQSDARTRFLEPRAASQRMVAPKSKELLRRFVPVYLSILRSNREIFWPDGSTRRLIVVIRFRVARDVRISVGPVPACTTPRLVPMTFCKPRGSPALTCEVGERCGGDAGGQSAGPRAVEAPRHHSRPVGERRVTPLEHTTPHCTLQHPHITNHPRVTRLISPRNITRRRNCPGAHGAAVAERLAFSPSHQGELGYIPCRITPGFSNVGIVPDHAAGRRVSLEFSRFTPPFRSGASP
ncbi:hypothetical protein PR048_022248 [Dryococelus australis]|uniref:Uncharacterized protein n=1 Tax=Dryococelus australis TaxID=614101 RepID=A0ABQ9H0Q5_9NEOP|nr:hypothetical protein PR048_022248 [Dryococelus australis]